eukprot:4387429-Pleurochrysis_carterae.AAC.1
MRGSYDREGKERRKGYKVQAGIHWTLIQETSTALANPCEAKCVNNGRCKDPFTVGDIIACHEYSY